MNKLFESELFQSLREFFSALTEKLSNMKILNFNPSKRVIAAGFGIIVALLLLMSGVFIIGERQNKKQENLLTTETTDAPEVAVSVPATKEIDSTFLFALTDNDNTTVHSIIVADFNSETESLQFRFINPDATVTVNETTGSIHSHLSDGGISEFLWAVSSHTGTGFNRYLVIQESDFVKLMSIIGDTEIEIENNISYDHNGISFIIDKGRRTLTADMMLKYCLYLSSNPQVNAEKISGLFITLIQRLFTAENDELLHDRFSSALSLFTTDISAIDFSDHKDAVRRIPAMALSEKAQIVSE